MSLQTFESFFARVDANTRTVTVTCAFTGTTPTLDADTSSLEIIISDGDKFDKIEKTATDIQAWLDAHPTDDYVFELVNSDGTLLDLDTFGTRLIIVASESDSTDVPIPTTTSFAANAAALAANSANPAPDPLLEVPPLAYTMPLDNSIRPNAPVLLFRDLVVVSSAVDNSSMDMTGSCVATFGEDNGTEPHNLRLFVTRKYGSDGPSLVQFEHAVTAAEIAAGEIVIDLVLDLQLTGLETNELVSIVSYIEGVGGLDSILSNVIQSNPSLKFATPTITSIVSGATPGTTVASIDFTPLQGKLSFYYKLYKKAHGATTWTQYSAGSSEFIASVNDDGENTDPYTRSFALDNFPPLSRFDVGVSVSADSDFIVSDTTGNPTAASDVTQSNISPAKKVMVGGAGTPSINVTFGALSGSNTRLIVAVTNDPTANSVPVARVVINVLKNGLDFQMNQVFAYSATGYSLPVFNVNTMTASDVFSVTADFARSLSASEITYHLYPVAETATWSTILYSIIDLGPTASEDDILPPVGLFIGSAPKPTISALFEAEDAGILKFIIQMDNTTTEADLINVYIANEIQFQTVSESVTSILNGLTIVDNNPADIYLSNNGTSFLANTTYAVSARYLFSDSLSAGPWSDPFPITTAADPPLPGATTVVLECTNGNAIVAWDAAQPSDVGTGYALQYYVELKNSVGTTLTSLTTSISSLNSDGNVQAEYTYSFTELTSDTSYTAVVTAAYVKTGSTTIYCQPAYSAEVYLHKIPAVTAIALDLTQTATVRLTITVNPYATPTNVNSVIAFMPYLGGFQLNATAINSSKTAWQTSAVIRNPAVDYDAVNAYVIAGGPGGFSYAVYPMSAA